MDEQRNQSPPRPPGRVEFVPGLWRTMLGGISGGLAPSPSRIRFLWTGPTGTLGIWRSSRGDDPGRSLHRDRFHRPRGCAPSDLRVDALPSRRQGLLARSVRWAITLRAISAGLDAVRKPDHLEDVRVRFLPSARDASKALEGANILATTAAWLLLGACPWLNAHSCPPATFASCSSISTLRPSRRALLNEPGSAVADVRLACSGLAMPLWVTPVRNRACTSSSGTAVKSLLACWPRLSPRFLRRVVCSTSAPFAWTIAVLASAPCAAPAGGDHALGPPGRR